MPYYLPRSRYLHFLLLVRLRAPHSFIQPVIIERLPTASICAGTLRTQCEQEGHSPCLPRANRAYDQAAVALSECRYKGEAQGWWDIRRALILTWKASRKKCSKLGLDSEED